MRLGRETRRQYRQILAIAQGLVYLENVRFFAHSRLREEQRAIARADAEACILSRDARIVGHNSNHPEGLTYTVSGRRVDGDEIGVVIAMDSDDLRRVTEMTIVTVMYQKKDAR
jgi:hypothetical protein